MKPLHNRLVVKRLQSESQTSFGLILEQEPTDQCEVIAIGPNVENVRAGETVIVGRNAGQAIKEGDDWLTVITEDDVLAVLED